MTRPPLLDDAVVVAWLEENPKWRRIDGHLVRELTTVDYPSSIDVVAAQVDVAEGLDHHPRVTIGNREVRLELWTHDRKGLTQLDLEYAQSFDQLVEERFPDVVVG